MRKTGYRFSAVVSAGRGFGSEIAEGEIPGEKTPCPACPDRACLATGEIAGGAPDSRHRRSRTPSRECGRSAADAVAGRGERIECIPRLRRMICWYPL